jgi:hypothetical protein
MLHSIPSALTIFKQKYAAPTDRHLLVGQNYRGPASRQRDSVGVAENLSLQFTVWRSGAETLERLYPSPEYVAVMDRVPEVLRE